MAALPARFTEGWAEENAIYRTARKTYRCEGSGGIPARHSDACPKLIRPGEAYIEYVGETPAYQRGSPHSIACAINFGFIKVQG